MSLGSHRVTSLDNGAHTKIPLEKIHEANREIAVAEGLVFDVGVQGVLDASIRD